MNMSPDFSPNIVSRLIKHAQSRLVGWDPEYHRISHLSLVTVGLRLASS